MGLCVPHTCLVGLVPMQFIGSEYITSIVGLRDGSKQEVRGELCVPSHKKRYMEEIKYILLYHLISPCHCCIVKK